MTEDKKTINGFDLNEAQAESTEENAPKAVKEEGLADLAPGAKRTQMRLIVQLAIPDPNAPFVDLLSIEEFYDVGDGLKITTSAIKEAITKDLNVLVQKARSHKFKKRSGLVKPNGEAA